MWFIFRNRADRVQAVPFTYLEVRLRLPYLGVDAVKFLPKFMMGKASFFWGCVFHEQILEMLSVLWRELFNAHSFRCEL